MTIQTVPYSAINRFEPDFLERWMSRVEKLTRSTQFIGGEWIQTLESKLAKKAAVSEARVCANGTDALQLALRALKIGKGDRVLIPNSTFWATFEAVCNVGANPITIDIDPEDLHPSEEIVEKAIQEFNPQAMILVHLYGWAARDTQKIRSLCEKKGIPLIEDSAQAWGTTLPHYEPLFKNALISTTSFYPGKVLGGAGDGGAVFTQDPQLANTVRLLANHGRLGKYEHHHVGWNSRLDVLQCAYLDLCLDYIDARITSRRNAVQWYRSHIRHPQIQFRSPAPGIEENGYISVATLDSKIRDQVTAELTKAKIGFGIVYPGPMSEQPGAKGWIAGNLDFGNTTRNCQSILNLPCFAGITEAELQFVQSHLEKILAELYEKN